MTTRLPACPLLPEPEGRMSWRDLEAAKAADEATHYLTCLRYARQLWELEGLPARALLAVDRGLFCELPSGHPLLARHPLPYAVVGWMVAQQAETPWLAFGLAATWGSYGVLRKRATIGAAAGLAVETILTAPIALAYLVFVEASGRGAFADGSLATQGWLASTGVVTAIPLWLFAYGASRIRLSTLGLLQYIAPSVQLALGIVLYGEGFSTDRAIGFACIWSGLAIYTIDNLAALRRRAS